MVPAVITNYITRTGEYMLRRFRSAIAKVRGTHAEP